ncbi:hypothetical protein [Rhodopirellula sp. P2]|uniref:hypothetical protein n=1 Tax=Rhodopirellula sp. P2 TaxID=2127060 RepID=UPI0023689797|nr:hypothetical protein [Rhodopirellula sp. P2]WDQ14609.1 hypothetical protein PSR62_13245 [Rhodopirellula sp. P2]
MLNESLFAAVATAVAIFKFMVLSFNPHDFAFTASLPKRTSVSGRVCLMTALWLVAWLQFLPPAFPPVSVAKSDSLSTAVSTLENVSIERSVAVESERGAASLAQVIKEARELSGSLGSGLVDPCDQASRLLLAGVFEPGVGAAAGTGDSLVNLHVRLQI